MGVSNSDHVGAIITAVLITTAVSSFVTLVYRGRTTMETRCNIACRDARTESWSDYTHVCACGDGAVYHIRSVVETIRPAPERGDR
jgi:hypothetical protein